jgi:cytochrome c oxidase cbb3-type subunit 2
MPAYPWLEKAPADSKTIADHMRALRTVGVPYTDEQITNAPKELEGKTEEDALIAYLQGLGLARRSVSLNGQASESMPIKPSLDSAK